jgi:hypothetical protein
MLFLNYNNFTFINLVLFLTAVEKMLFVFRAQFVF